MDKCPNSSAGEKVDSTGCPPAEKPAEIKKGAKMILRGVNFESGSAALTPESYPVLDQVYESMNAYPEVKVEIRGYTDNQGSYEENLGLSRRRAEAVMNYLVNRNIEPGRIRAKGFGPADPIASNKTESGRAQNRRIEFQRTD
jgi:OmpA-OmpF porin, OOP family